VRGEGAGAWSGPDNAVKLRPATILAMHNPWPDLPPRSPYILDIDRDSIEQYNESVRNSLVQPESRPFEG
jgi:hypothetical protein